MVFSDFQGQYKRKVTTLFMFHPMGEGKHRWKATNIKFKCMKYNLHISCLFISQWPKPSHEATPDYKGT